MHLRQFSGIARPVDPAYATNRAILVVTVAVVVATGLIVGFGETDWIAASGEGLLMGLAVFLAWALGRELDPDRDSAAFLGAGLTIAGVVAFGSPSIAPLLALLLAVRVVNRTTGLPASLGDRAGLLALSVWLGARGEPIYLMATAAALMLDGRLTSPRDRLNLSLGVAALAAAVGLVVSGYGRPLEPHPFAILSAGAIAVLFIPAIHDVRRLSTRCDDTDEPLTTPRVRAGQLIALGAGVLATVWHGPTGLIALLPLWAAIVGAGIGRLSGIFR